MSRRLLCLLAGQYDLELVSFLCVLILEGYYSKFEFIECNLVNRLLRWNQFPSSNSILGSFRCFG